MQASYADVSAYTKDLIVTFPDKVEDNEQVGFEAITAMSIEFIIVGLIIFGTVVDRTTMFNCNKVAVAVPQEEQDEDSDEDRQNVQDYRRSSEIVLQSKTTIGRFLSSFSIPRNFSRIFIDNFSLNRELKIFNGLFVVSFLMVIYNNIWFVGAMYGIIENTRFSEYEHKFPEFTLLRLRLSYEIFFFSIGFTSAVKMWTNYYNHDKNENVVFELLRYSYRRFIPQAFLIFSTIFLFAFYNHGPLYQF